MAEHKEACIKSGMDDYLSKPVNSDKLKVLLYLLAYSYNEEEITLLAVGFYEVFYRDLKKTLLG